MNPGLSILMPVYNSAAFLEESVSQLIRFLSKHSTDYEILLGDDASMDHSPRLMDDLARRHASVRCFYHSRNQGLGVNLRRLMREARGEIWAYMDADLPFGVEVLGGLIPYTRNYDVVVASRYLGIPARVTWERRVASRLYYFFCERCFGVTVRDLGSGTVLMKKVKCEDLPLEARGFAIHAEFFVKARARGLSVKEVGWVSRRTGKGSFRICRHGWETLRETVDIWRKLKLGAAFF